MVLKKKKGSLEIFVYPVLCSIIALVVLLGVRLKVLKTAKYSIEDSLVASNLAAATVDLKEYGSTNLILNNNFNKSYEDYCKALKENLKLDENFNPKSKSIIESKVDIVDFTIYNVNGNDIEKISKSPNGVVSSQTFPNAVGTLKTPDGVTITTTLVYSKIGFSIKGYLDKTLYVYKDNSVDITDKD